MKKSFYFRVIFLLFWVGLLVCGSVGIYLKLFVTDPQTGFYSSQTILIPLFRYLLTAVVILMVLLTLLKRVDNDYPIVRDGVGTGILSILSGISLALYMLEDTGWMEITGNLGASASGTGRIVSGVLGMLAAVSLLMLGVARVLRLREAPGAIAVLCPAIWQMVTLAMKFNNYITLTTIIDNLLIVLFMAFSSIFLMGHARTFCGFARTNARNYMIPSGLITAIMGLLLTVPNFIYMIVYRTGIPAPALGDMESLYIFFFSLFAFSSVVRLRRSIAIV